MTELDYLAAIVHLLELIRVTLLYGLGLSLGCQIWRNFTVAKNQKYFW